MELAAGEAGFSSQPSTMELAAGEAGFSSQSSTMELAAGEAGFSSQPSTMELAAGEAGFSSQRSTMELAAGDVNPVDRAAAEAARGFMPPEEGLALWRAATEVLAGPLGAQPMLEVGAYCGKSALYLGPAGRDAGAVLFSVDHHRGSEENQVGWEWHEPDLVDEAVGRMDTLPVFRRTVHDAGLEDTVIAVVGDSPTVARHWATPLSLLFIDGGHGAEPAHADYEQWTPQVAAGGLLCIHDVFPDPADGGRPPYEIYCRALESGRFSERSATGSLRVLARTSDR